MMNYAWNFSQSETEKYFEWIISHFISWSLFLFSFSVLCKPLLHLQWRRRFLILLRDYSQLGVLRGAHLKLGCFIVSYLHLVRWHNIAWSRWGRKGMFHFSLFKLVQRHKADFDADCRLSFVCSRKPSCGQVVTCKCCCLSNVFTLFVSNVSELLQYKKSTWWAKTKNRDPLYGNSL